MSTASQTGTHANFGQLTVDIAAGLGLGRRLAMHVFGEHGKEHDTEGHLGCGCSHGDGAFDQAWVRRAFFLAGASSLLLVVLGCYRNSIAPGHPIALVISGRNSSFHFFLKKYHIRTESSGYFRAFQLS